MQVLPPPQNPLREQCKSLLKRFLDDIERKLDAAMGEIPEMKNGQWRTVSAVLATYRAAFDEAFGETEMELARLDYSRLTIDELRELAERFRDHPLMDASEVVEVKVRELEGTDGEYQPESGME